MSEISQSTDDTEKAEYTFHNTCIRPKKVNYMFLRPRLHHFQLPASKIFIAFQLINVKNRRHIVNYQFSLAAICLVYGWLVEFWCTCSHDSAPHIKSRKF